MKIGFLGKNRKFMLNPDFLIDVIIHVNQNRTKK